MTVHVIGPHASTTSHTTQHTSGSDTVLSKTVK